MIKFFTKRQGGFTLIELLVVITIIGILSGIVVVAVGDASARARDSRRLADVRQLAFILERDTAAEPAKNLDGCAANASTTQCTGPGHVGHYFEHISDPGANPDTAVCQAAQTAPCNYGINSDPDVIGLAGLPDNIRNNDYMICFSLETNVDDMGVGIHSIRTGARLVEGCP